MGLSFRQNVEGLIVRTLRELTVLDVIVITAAVLLVSAAVLVVWLVSTMQRAYDDDRS